MILWLLLVYWIVHEQQHVAVMAISGGRKIGKQEFSWFTALRLSDNTILCSGALVASRFVMTSRGCGGDVFLRGQGHPKAQVGYWCSDHDNCGRESEMLRIIGFDLASEGCALLELERAVHINVTPAVPYMGPLHHPHQNGIQNISKLVMVGGGQELSSGNVSHYVKALGLKIFLPPKELSPPDQDSIWLLAQDGNPCLGDSGAALTVPGKAELQGREIIVALKGSRSSNCANSSMIHIPSHYRTESAEKVLLKEVCDGEYPQDWCSKQIRNANREPTVSSLSPPTASLRPTSPKTLQPVSFLLPNEESPTAAPRGSASSLVFWAVLVSVLLAVGAAVVLAATRQYRAGQRSRKKNGQNFPPEDDDGDPDNQDVLQDNHWNNNDPPLEYPVTTAREIQYGGGMGQGHQNDDNGGEVPEGRREKDDADGAIVHAEKNEGQGRDQEDILANRQAPSTMPLEVQFENQSVAISVVTCSIGSQSRQLTNEPDDPAEFLRLRETGFPVSRPPNQMESVVQYSFWKRMKKKRTFGCFPFFETSYGCQDAGEAPSGDGWPEFCSSKNGTGGCLSFFGGSRCFGSSMGAALHTPAPSCQRVWLFLEEPKPQEQKINGVGGTKSPTRPKGAPLHEMAIAPPPTKKKKHLILICNAVAIQNTLV